MNYRFAIQASNPRFLKHFNAEDTSLCDAIQTVFPLEAEYAILVWNWVYVPLTYKYDLSMMVDDVLLLALAMLSESNGCRTIQWPSNTFASSWKVEWATGVTTVEAEWTSVIGDTEAMLAAAPKVVMEAKDFVAEWRRPLEVIMTGLASAGYTTNLAGMERLIAVVNKIGHQGIFYRLGSELGG